MRWCVCCAYQRLVAPLVVRICRSHFAGFAFCTLITRYIVPATTTSKPRIPTIGKNTLDALPILSRLSSVWKISASSFGAVAHARVYDKVNRARYSARSTKLRKIKLQKETEITRQNYTLRVDTVSPSLHHPRNKLVAVKLVMIMHRDTLHAWLPLNWSLR